MSRFTLIGSAVAAVLAAYFFLISPLSEKREELKENLYTQHKTLVKYEKFISNTKQSEEELLHAREKLREMEQYIIDKPDVSLAFAELQTSIQKMAKTAGLSITSIKPLPAVDYPGYKGLPLLVEATGNIGNFGKFLNHLDSTWQFISVDKINVNTAPRDKLRVKVQLTGLMRA